MSRPGDWYVLDLDGDPTPGDPFRVRELARRFLSLAADAFAAAAEVRRLAGEDGVVGWVGQAGLAFAAAVGELPGQLDKLEASHSTAGRALRVYADDLETAQTQADAALARGREARARLVSVLGQLDTATAAVDTSRESLDPARGLAPLTTVPASWWSSAPPSPDPADVAAASRAHDAAVAHLAYVNGLAGDAQEDVDSERRLALAAKNIREQAARTCQADLERASDAGIQNRSFWGGLGDLVSDVWDGAVQVAKVVVVVAGIAAFLVGGPLAWVAFAAALVVLADTVHLYANGEATLWDVGLAALQCIPCTTGLTTVASLARGAQAAASGLRGTVVAGAALGRGALSAGTTSACTTRLAELANSIRTGTGSGLTTIRRSTLMGSGHYELEGIVDVGFTRHATRIGNDRRTLAVSNHAQPLDGYHDVVIHGSPDDFVPLGPGHVVNPAHVAEAILANPHYVPGTPVRAISCWTGRNGVDGPAQRLADHLQVEVLAPTVLAGVPAGLGRRGIVLGIGDDVVAPGSVVTLENGQEVVAEWIKLTPRSHPPIQ